MRMQLQHHAAQPALVDDITSSLLYLDAKHLQLSPMPNAITPWAECMCTLKGKHAPHALHMCLVGCYFGNEIARLLFLVVSTG